MAHIDGSDSHVATVKVVARPGQLDGPWHTLVQPSVLRAATTCTPHVLLAVAVRRGEKGWGRRLVEKGSYRGKRRKEVTYSRIGRGITFS